MLLIHQAIKIKFQEEQRGKEDWIISKIKKITAN